jgi:aldose 1-epimerase
LRWPGAVEVTLSSDVSLAVIYDQPEHAVCVEPQTDPPDALNLRPHLVEPDQPLVARTTWSWALG